MLLDEPSNGGIRMVQLKEGRKEVLAQMKSDTRLTEPAKKKRLYRDLLEYGITRLTFDEYNDFERGLL